MGEKELNFIKVVGLLRKCVDGALAGFLVNRLDYLLSVRLCNKVCI